MCTFDQQLLFFGLKVGVKVKDLHCVPARAAAVLACAANTQALRWGLRRHAAAVANLIRGSAVLN